MSKRAYLREVEIKYKLKKVESEVVGLEATDPDAVVQLFSDLRNDSKEKLIAISLDARNKILCFEVVAIGSVDTISLRPGELFRTAIVFNAISVIAVHNHPSGDPKPTQADRDFTKKLEAAAGTLGIQFLDHIIVGADGYFSFASEGLLF